MKKKEYLKVNLHTHTTRCGHAEGADREYIEAAISAGIRVLGFSDHIPLPTNPYMVTEPRIRMSSETAPEYIGTLKTLKEEYKDDICILIGYEGEYIKAFFKEQMKLVDSLGCDYLILGQHFIKENNEWRYTGRWSVREGFLTDYVDTCIEGLKTGRYAYLAHPDLIYYEYDSSVYNREMTRLCSFCKEADIPLEINLHGLLDGRHYPSKNFFRIAGEIGNKAVMGIDAHSPEEIGNTDCCNAALELASECGLEILEEFLPCR